jgi:hypothetical protein
MSQVTIKTYTYKTQVQPEITVTNTEYSAKRQTGLINNKTFLPIKGQYYNEVVTKIILKEKGTNNLFWINALDYRDMLRGTATNVEIRQVTYHSKEIGYTTLDWKQKQGTYITEYTVKR